MISPGTPSMRSTRPWPGAPPTPWGAPPTWPATTRRSRTWCALRARARRVAGEGGVGFSM